MLLSVQLYACCLVGISVIYFVLRPFIVYFRDPLGLRKYPAPSFLAALTPLWLIRATWSQSRSKIIHREILRLGDVIRVSPNHVIFNDPAAIKDIYGVLAISHGVAKDDFYDRLAGDAHDLVQVRDRGEHTDRRKAIANAFASKTVVNMEPVIRKTFYQLLVKLDRHVDQPIAPGNKAPVNLRKWYVLLEDHFDETFHYASFLYADKSDNRLNFFTLDVIGDAGFGLPMGFLQNLADSTDAETQEGSQYRVTDMIDVLHRGVRYSLTMGNITSHRLSRLLKSIVAKFPPLASLLGSTCADDFENICIGKLRQRIKQGAPSRGSGDFMTFILEDKARSGETDGKRCYSYSQFRSLVADSQMVMNAGSDTTAAALTSTVWFLLKTPHALARLRDELSPLIPRPEKSDDASSAKEISIFDYSVVKDLPYLRACIDESLRLRPPIAYQLPRLVSRPVTIAGHDVLPGTVVAVAPYSVHRHPALYRDPDEYRPERWVDFDEAYPNQREDLKKYNIVFSQGSRACIGRHLAIVELQILVSTLLMRYVLVSSHWCTFSRPPVGRDAVWCNET